MSTWYKVAWIDPLFAAFNAVAPNRGHAEDGTIGDLAHAQGVSGHNPDDTPGVQAERQDADTKPEVRAADVDAHLNAAVTMEQCVQAVLHAPPAERDRLIYIIYNHRIWRKDNGWRQETYTGSDPHDQHAHFSGDPAADDNNAPWTSILALGDDMEQTEQVKGNLTKGNSVGDVFADLSNNRDWWYAPPGGKTNNPPPAGSRADIVLKAAQQVLAAPPVAVTMSADDRQAIVADVVREFVQQLGALRFEAAPPAAG